jgi:hypothetical protein
MLRTIRPILILWLLAATLSAAAQSASKVRLVSGGRTHNLKFVSGTRYEPREGPAEVRLLFTAVTAEGLPLADAFRPDEFAVPRWSRASGTPAVLVTFEEKKTESTALRIFFPEGHQLDGRVARSGKAGRGAFRKLEVKADVISGEFSHKGSPGTLSGTFIARLPTVKQAAERRGAEVAGSPQGEALLAYARHMRKMDIRNAQKYAAGDLAAHIETLRRTYGEQAVKTLVRDRFGDLKQFERDLRSPQTVMLESADRAEIRLPATKKSREAETETFRFVSDSGAWKVRVE